MAKVRHGHAFLAIDGLLEERFPLGRADLAVSIRVESAHEHHRELRRAQSGELGGVLEVFRREHAVAVAIEAVEPFDRAWELLALDGLFAF